LSDDALGQKQLKKKKTAPSPSGKKLNKKKPDGDDDDNVKQYGKKLKKSSKMERSCFWPFFWFFFCRNWGMFCPSALYRHVVTLLNQY